MLQPKPSIMNISPYVAGKSKAAGAQRIIKLSSNENPLGPSPKAIEAFKAQAQNLHRYPDSGHGEMREAIGEVYGLNPANLICSAGSDELIGMLVQAYTQPGDEVLYPAHGFLMYKIYALSHGAVPVTAPEKNLRTDVDALLAAVTPKTKIVFLANPNNPTGSYITKDEMQRLRAGLRADILLAIDDAYSEYVTAADYSTGEEIVASSDNTVMLRTFSKIYGLPALRLGWGYAPAGIIDVLNRIRGPFNVSAPALAAGIAAVRDTAYTRHVRDTSNAELARVSAALSRHFTVYPSVTNFVMIELDSPEGAAACNAHLTERGLITREIGAYGLGSKLRISIGTAEENDLLIAALDEFAAKKNAAA